MTPALKELGALVEAILPEDVLKVEDACGDLVLWTRRESLTKLLTHLRDDPNALFKQLVELTAVDYPARQERFDVVYLLLSLKHNLRVRVKVTASEETPLPTVFPIFSSAMWLEREVWDMYGIFFEDHPDMRRILTDYGFDGHPLRKDFPLSGHVEVRYDQDQKRVVYEPVKLAQEYRNFDFESPWEGMLHLPKDENAEGQGAGEEDAK
jgi:NADH-quinone oxidoreductase subunit C|tara:strand:- start:7409 stop:8035 length:627 start_codon:yes stop_codon:yes gene_type:complete